MDALDAVLREQTEWECDAPRNIKVRATWFGCQRADGGLAWKAARGERDQVVSILRDYGGRGEEPVLLVHGASAWRGTFFEPDGGLVRRLQERFSVWTLDWRASKTITDPWRAIERASVPPPIRNAQLDDAAEHDLASAVQHMQTQRPGLPPRIVAHCMGSAITALAIERGMIGVGHDARARIAPELVLSAMGLFYRGGVDTWFRGQERAGEEPDADESHWYLDFTSNWPSTFERVFEVWQNTPYPHCSLPLCQRISCLIGAPYRPDDISYLHDDMLAGLSFQFGVMPISLLKHCAQNLRRGYAARFNADESSERSHEPRLRQAPFRDLEITLLTGSENQLWHRDSIDRMHEWLQRDPLIRPHVHKHVLPEYGHQDLWWSRRSSEPDGVYDLVLRGLSTARR